MKVYAGEQITRACQKLAAAAPAWMEFNGVRIEARGGETPADLEASWRRGMDEASEAAARKRREFEATPEGQRQLAEAKRKADEKKRLQREVVAVIEASGLRESHPWRPGMREISGFGGGYEDACWTMMYAGLLWLRENPEADYRGGARDAFEKAILRAEPDCSGAMFGAAASHAAFIKENGYEAWAARMSTVASLKRDCGLVREEENADV
jgi:hypothetical protein